MSMPSNKTIVFNAAASLVAIAAVVGVVRTWLVPSAVKSCSDRYSTSMVFPLERNGVTFTFAYTNDFLANVRGGIGRGNGGRNFTLASGMPWPRSELLEARSRCPRRRRTRRSVRP